MKEHWHLERRGGLEEGIETAVVGIKLLPARMELGALEAKLTHRALELVDCQLAFPRVNSGETDKAIGVLATGDRELVIGVRGYPRSRLGVSAEQYGQRVEGGITRRGSIQIFMRPGTAKEALRVLELASPGAGNALVGRVDVYINGKHRCCSVSQGRGL